MPSTKSRTKLKFDAIGVPWEIEVFDGKLDPLLESAIQKKIDGFDASFSRFRNDSWVTMLSRKAGSYSLPEDAHALLKFYEELYDLTDGRVTPLIGKTMEEAGYDANYRLRPTALTALPGWKESVQLSSTSLATRQPVHLDFGAAGKGYLVDLVAQVMVSHGHKSFVIDASGDMLVHQALPAQRVGLENPSNTAEIIGYIDIVDGALCASAGNRRRWATYSHIIDPHSLQSPTNIQATWVLAESAVLADGLSTALFFCSAEKLQKKYTFEYAMVASDNQVSASRGFPGIFFTSNSSR